MKIVFMGTPDFAVPSLQALIDSKHDVIAVYSQPPQKANRGHKLTQTPVHQLAEVHNIPVYTPKKFTDDAIAELEELKPDLIAVAAYGLLLPEDVLNIAPCINVHPSALPRWRGAAPLHHTILAGDTETDVCIMHMEKGLDSGPVYLRKTYKVGENETVGELHDRLSTEGATLLLEVINKWGKVSAKKQSTLFKKATYAHKFKSAELKLIRTINFNRPVREVHNHIRGLSPWPGAITTHYNKVDGTLEFKILRAEIVKLTEFDEEARPGDILFAEREHGIIVACKDGAIRLKEIQRPGKKALADTEFLKGYAFLKPGQKLT